MACRTGAASSTSSDTLSRNAAAAVRRAHSTGEAVNRAAAQTIADTGTLHEFVDLTGPYPRRISRNSFERNADGQFALVFGPQRSGEDNIDGTNSFEHYYEITFLQTGGFIGGLQLVNSEVNWQASIGIVQDKDDVISVRTPGGRKTIVKRGQYGEVPRRIAIMATMFEADGDKILAQMQQLYPANKGGDGEEDYQLVLAKLAWKTESDSLRYGRRPYAFITGDQIGRDVIDPDVVYEQLGIHVQRMETRELAAQVMPLTHFFYLCVDGGGSVKRWWDDTLGETGHVVHLPRPEYSGPMKAALVLVTESGSTTQQEVVDFTIQVSGNSNYRLDRRQATEIYDEIMRAGVHLGAGVSSIPMPRAGDIFDHPRNPWPIGHRYYQSYQDLGLPDPEAGVETPFTPLVEAKLAVPDTGSTWSSGPTIPPSTPHLDINWDNLDNL